MKKILVAVSLVCLTVVSHSYGMSFFGKSNKVVPQQSVSTIIVDEVLKLKIKRDLQNCKTEDDFTKRYDQDINGQLFKHVHEKTVLEAAIKIGLDTTPEFQMAITYLQNAGTNPLDIKNAHGENLFETFFASNNTLTTATIATAFENTPERRIKKLLKERKKGKNTKKTVQVIEAQQKFLKQLMQASGHNVMQVNATATGLSQTLQSTHLNSSTPDIITHS